MKKTLSLLLLLFLGFGCNTSEKEIVDQKNSERKSIHQLESEKYTSKIESNEYTFEVTNITTLTDSSLGLFTRPKFSADGQHLFFTVPGYHQIWHYNFSNSTLEKIVELPLCGKDFQLIDDGNSVVFRNKAAKGNEKQIVYSILKCDVETKSIQILYSTDKRITVPICVAENLYFLEKGIPKNYNLKNGQIERRFPIPFYYVENKHLIKYIDKKDSLKIINNKYNFVNINYSSDFESIQTLTFNNGIILFDIDANPLNIFKNAFHLNKLLKSNLVVFTEERDDGTKIFDSKMKIGFTDSPVKMDINFDSNDLCLYPSWSPTENKIACSTNNGQIKIISFNLKKI